MIATLICLCLLCLYDIGFGRERAFIDYLSKNRTDSIKGIFILLVFISHSNGYYLDAGYVFHGLGDMVFRKIMVNINQLMVVMFLFYSGYGVMEGIARKRVDYINKMPLHRIVSTLVNYDIAVCIFLVVDIALKKHITVSQFLLTLVAWDTIGNSNWYIFVILICYIVTWILAKTNIPLLRIGLYSFIPLICITFLLSLEKEPYWYNTMLAYPLGMVISTYKDKIEVFTDNHYFPTLAILSVLFVMCFYQIPFEMGENKLIPMGLVFAMLLVTITMRVRIGNPVLQWLGQNLFPIYIYQRIPMMVLASVLPSWMLTVHPIIFVALSFVLTIMITYAYRYFRVTI